MDKMPVSIVDLVPVQTGSTPRTGLAHLLTLAREAEDMGYHRIWVAEHHGSPASASAAPPIMTARIAATTSRIRVGAGGVMLPNHPALIVAEQFATLSAFDPERIDLGIGRGPGAADEATIKALLRGLPPVSHDQYAEQVRDLLGFFGNPAVPGEVPQVWLLSSSVRGAGLAANLGLPLSFGYHFKPEQTGPALELYRRSFRPSRWSDRPRVMLSVVAVCAETDEQAERLARPADVFWADLLAGRANTFPTPEDAAAYHFSDDEEEARRRRRSFEAVGSAGTVAEKLSDIVARTRPDELILFSHIYDIAAKVRSYRLIAERLLT